MNYLQRALQFRTHTSSLTFDLTSDPEKLPKNWGKKLSHDEKRRNLQESRTEEDPSPGWTAAIDVSCDQNKQHLYVQPYKLLENIIYLILLNY